MHEFGDDTPILAYDFGESLVGGAVTAYEVGGLSPDETALHIPSVRALASPTARSATATSSSSCPTSSWTTPSETKADLKRGFGGLADQLDFDVLLAHGTPYPSGGRDALRRFAAS